jgi:hypothetical protein
MTGREFLTAWSKSCERPEIAMSDALQALRDIVEEALSQADAVNIPKLGRVYVSPTDGGSGCPIIHLQVEQGLRDTVVAAVQARPSNGTGHVAQGMVRPGRRVGTGKYLSRGRKGHDARDKYI